MICGGILAVLIIAFFKAYSIGLVYYVEGALKEYKEELKIDI